MADDLAAEFAALQSNPSVSTPINPDAESEAGYSPASGGDPGRAAPVSSDPGGSTPGADANAPPAANAPAAAADPAAPATVSGEQAPLSYEEMEKRWRDQQGAMRAERARRREAEQASALAASREEERLKLYQDNFAKLVAGMQRADGQAQQPQYAEPTPIDVLNALADKVTTYEQREAQRAEQERQQHAQQRQQQAQAQAIQGLVSDIMRTEADFRTGFPDYDAATNHYLGVRMTQITAMGYPPDVAQRAVQEEMLQAAHRAFQADQNPAEMVYNAARQLGYRRAASPSNAAPAAPAGRPVAPATSGDPLAQVRAAQAAASSLSAGGSGEAPSELTLESIIGLQGAAFDSASEKFLRKMRGRD